MLAALWRTRILTDDEDEADGVATTKVVKVLAKKRPISFILELISHRGTVSLKSSR